jgi:hypothetical protein
MQAPRPVVGVVSIAAVIVGAWFFRRSARLSTVFTSEGIVVCNPFRTYRVDWGNVAWFGNGTFNQGEAGIQWVLAIGTTMPERTICCVSTVPRNRYPSDRASIMNVVQPLAASRGIPVRFDDPRSATAPGLTRLYSKLGLARTNRD